MTDQELILQTLKRQFASLLQSPDYEGYSLRLMMEESFVESEDTEPNAIVIVVKLLPATINFGQRAIPFSLDALSEMNSLEVAFKLLSEFAIANNLRTSEDAQVTQTYTTPTVTGNFYEVYEGYRSNVYMTGTFIITSGANPFDAYYDGEKLPTITSTVSFDNQLDTQATYDSEDRTTSRTMFGTLTLNMTLYFAGSGICSDALKVMNAEYGVDRAFPIELRFKGTGDSIGEYNFRLVTASIQKNVGEIPVISISLAR